MFRSSLSILSQLSWFVTPDACFKSDNAAAFSEKLKERPCSIQLVIDCTCVICIQIWNIGDSTDGGYKLSQQMAVRHTNVLQSLFRFPSLLQASTTCIFSVMVIWKCPSRVTMHYLIMNNEIGVCENRRERGGGKCKIIPLTCVEKTDCYRIAYRWEQHPHTE